MIGGMARTLPELGAARVAEIEAAWARPQPDWARKRLLVVLLIAQHELTVAQIVRVADVSRQTVFTYRDKVVAGGVAALLALKWAGARRPLVRGALAVEFTQLLESGRFRRAKDAQAWLRKRARRTLSVSGVRKVLRKLGGKLNVPRKSHARKDPAKAQASKRELPASAGGPGRPGGAGWSTTI
jgi:transposase